MFEKYIFALSFHLINHIICFCQFLLDLINREINAESIINSESKCDARNKKRIESSDTKRFAPHNIKTQLILIV